MTSDVLMGGKYDRAHMRLPIVSFYRSIIVSTVDTIGKRIRDARQAKHLTQVQMAALIGIDQSTLSLLENGKSVDLMGTTLAKLCLELSTSAEYIVLGIEPKLGPLTAAEAEALSLLRRTSDENRDAALRAVRAIATPQPKRKAA